MLRRIVAIFLLFFSASAWASCYVGLGTGRSVLDKSITSRQDRLLGSDYVEGGYATENVGRMRDVFLGCGMPWDTAVEVGQTTGTIARVDTSARLVYPGVPGSVPFTLRESIEVKISTVSVLKYVNIGPVAVFGRVGYAHTEARAEAVLPLGDGYSVRYEKNKDADSPYLGAGIAWRQDRLVLRLEHQVYAKQFRITTANVAIAF